MTEKVKGKVAHGTHADPKTKAQNVKTGEPKDVKKAPPTGGSPTTKL